MLIVEQLGLFKYAKFIDTYFSEPTMVLSHLHTTYIPSSFLGCTYSKVSGNFSPSGCTKTTPDSLEITNEVLLVFKDPVDDFGFSVGATDMLSTLKYKFN